MSEEHPIGHFNWGSAPLGASWRIDVVLHPDLVPDASQAIAELAVRAQRAHKVDTLRAMFDRWASDHDLRVVDWSRTAWGLRVSLLQG
jgi:hypothetical protein